MVPLDRPSGDMLVGRPSIKSTSRGYYWPIKIQTSREGVVRYRQKKLGAVICIYPAVQAPMQRRFGNLTCGYHPIHENKRSTQVIRPGLWSKSGLGREMANLPTQKFPAMSVIKVSSPAPASPPELLVREEPSLISCPTDFSGLRR